MAKKKAPAPPPSSAPRDLPALQAASRDGDLPALLAWADALEEAGSPHLAATLRRAPLLRDAIGREVKSWRKSYGDASISLHHSKRGSYWFCGDSEMDESADDEGDDPAAVIGQLLAAWNDLHPAVEWVLRPLRLLRVRCDIAPCKGRKKVPSLTFHLTDHGGHLGPIPDDQKVTTVWCNE